MSEEISTPRSVPPVVEHQPAAECDLSDLRREVIESRNLVIKTDNLPRTCTPSSSRWAASRSSSRSGT